MAAAIEAIVQAQLAPAADVSRIVMDLTGARIRARRTTLAPAASGTRRRASYASDVSDDDLPGPRASSPDAALESEPTFVGRGRVVVTHARRSLSPLTPTVPLAVSAVSAPPTPPPRAPSVPTFPTTGTPGDFVIPIDVTETLNEAAPRRKVRVVALGVAALVLALAAGVALRPAAFQPRQAPAAATAPPRAEPLPPSAPSAERPPGTPEAGAIATAPAARASASGRRTAPSPPAAKPRRSVHEPNSP
jgi:hypothetical protein